MDTAGDDFVPPGSITLGPDRTGRTVHIADGVIAARPAVGAPTLACPDATIEPGAVCAHTHLYSGLAPLGMPAAAPKPATFLEILERVWWRLDRGLDADSLMAAARLAIAEALLAGTTTLVDHHESPAFIEGSLTVLKAAAEDLGIRALLCYGISERNFGRIEAERGLAECAMLGESGRVRGLVGLHASFTLTDDMIREAGRLAAALGRPVHVHVAEDRADIADAIERGYPGPLERLIDLGALPDGSIIAHGVHLSRGQVRRATGCGAWFVHNPRSNEGNGVGYAGALSASDKVALGTDGWPADMAVEEAALARLAALHGDAGTAGRLAAGGRLVAERFGFAASGLETGAAGDLVVRQQADGRVVHVVVGGRVVVRDGALAGHPIEDIRAEAAAEAARLWRRMEAL